MATAVAGHGVRGRRRQPVYSISLRISELRPKRFCRKRASWHSINVRGHSKSALLSCLLMSFFMGTTSAYAQSERYGVEHLTPEEQALLAHGRLVKRQQSQMIGGTRLYGGTSWQRVRHSPQVVWQAVLDTPRYTQIMPQVTEARLIHQEGSKRVVHFRHGQGLLSLQYALVMHCSNDAQAVHFYVDQTRPRSIRQGRGFIVVRPHGEGQSLVVFNVFADLGSGMISSILRPQIQDGVLGVPYSLKRYVEGAGRNLYAGTTPE